MRQFGVRQGEKNQRRNDPDQQKKIAIRESLLPKSFDHGWNQNAPGREAYSDDNQIIVSRFAAFKKGCQKAQEIFLPKEIAQVTWIFYLGPHVPRSSDSKKKQSAADDFHPGEKLPSAADQQVEKNHQRWNRGANRTFDQGGNADRSVHQQETSALRSSVFRHRGALELEKSDAGEQGQRHVENDDPGENKKFQAGG